MQLTFWERATNFTGDMVDLLLFAFIVWQLLEYRMDEHSWRLTVVAVAYGAGIAESWAFTGFLPIFLVAIIWLKGLEFFDFGFLLRTFLCGLAGMSLFLLLPLVAELSGSVKFGFWEMLRPNLAVHWNVITMALGQSSWRHNLAEATLSTLVPVLVLTLRWSASFGDSSRIGSMLAINMMHFVHAAIFGVCMWAMFDPPFGAEQLLGQPSLTLYYLAALSIGYFCGYFLLVFGKRPAPTRRNSRPASLLPPGLMWVCPLIVAGTFVAGVLGVWTLVYRNAPAIREINGDVLQKFAAASTENLPKDGAIVLSDSDRPGQDVPLRSIIIQARLAQEGRYRNFPVVDTQLATWRPYQQYLNKKFPRQWPIIAVDTNTETISPLQMLGKLGSLSQSNTLCYANPSYGYYFEYFYQEPHGLVYLMKKIPEDTLLPPPPDPKLIAENEEFWTRTTKLLRPAVLKALGNADTTATAQPVNLPARLLARLHPTPVVNQNALLVGMLCSRSLVDWGVQLQQAGELEKAAVRFKAAKEFNPDNVVADINLAFNKTLRDGAPMEIDPSRVTADQFGKYRNWNDVITANGPFDEISFCFEEGWQLVQNGYLRQAAIPFTRVYQLAPTNLATRLELAQIYLYNHLPDRAMSVLQDPLNRPSDFGLNETNSTGVNILAASIFFQKNEDHAAVHLMQLETDRHPEDEMLLKTVTQAYFMRGRYTDALKVIDSKLARTPDDVQWLFGKGYASIQTSNYDNAIATMTRVMEIQTNDPGARFNRALAYFGAGKLDQARADYSALQTAHSNSFQIAYGLGEIAARQHDTNEAIRNFQIYLANAPTNSVEYKTVRDTLTQLRGK